MSDLNSTDGRRKPGYGLIILILFVIVLGYCAIRYVLDLTNYNAGHQAYLKGECALAIDHFDKTIHAWRIVNIGGFPDLSQKEKTECLPFLAADDQEMAGDHAAAILAFAEFVLNYSNSALEDMARERSKTIFSRSDPNTLATRDTCGKIDSLLGNGLILESDANLPPFYFNCGELYDKENNAQGAFDMYTILLDKYADHALANTAETKMLGNLAACHNVLSLKNNLVISGRADFIPKLYNTCGQAYEKSQEWSDAINMYEHFLAEYPDHPLASDVESALARAIVAQAKTSSAGVIPAPERSGYTTSGTTEVVIQNDSPEELRIVFSGPEARVEELEQCTTCRDYQTTGPLICPEQGPIGRYSLTPGDYDVVVESISNSGVTPWTGDWMLDSGSKYYSCFFVVTKSFP